MNSDKLYNTGTQDIAARLGAVRARITAAEQRYGRTPGSVTLLAVSKRKSAADVRAAIACGQRQFGENFVQEALEKVESLAGIVNDAGAEWHFIGPVQRNKTRAIAEHFSWIHSVERTLIAERLSQQRPAGMPPLNVCIQVNINHEVSKSGADVAALPQLADEITALNAVRLRGLMAIPLATSDVDEQRRNVARLREALEDLNTRGHELDTLSVGMSSDMEAAIAEGSTMVRIGTAIFGARD